MDRSVDTGSLLGILDLIGEPQAYDPTADWTQHAECLDEWSAFDKVFGKPSRARTEALEDIDQLCLSCPVRRECLDAGLANAGYGVWGGFELRHGKPVDAVTAAGIAAFQRLDSSPTDRDDDLRWLTWPTDTAHPTQDAREAVA